MLNGKLSFERIDSAFIDYVEDGRSIPFWWRTNGSDWRNGSAGEVIAYIYRPVAMEWRQKFAWAADRKQEITDLVIAHLRTKLPPFTVKFDTEAILALKKI